MGDVLSKHSSDDDPHPKFQGKAERILGPSITEILKKTADKATTPEESQNMLSELTTSFVEGVKKDSFLEKTVESMSIDAKTKREIAEAMLPSKFLSLVENHIQNMIKNQDIQGDPQKLSPEQKEIIKLYLKAAYYYGKGERYQKFFKLFASHNPAKLIAGLKDITNQFRENAEIQNLLGVEKDSNGCVTNIDLSKFEPRVADLSKLDLSGIMGYRFDVKNVDRSDYKHALARLNTPERFRIKLFLSRATVALKNGYDYETHTKAPYIYREVLKAYINLKTFDTIEKANLKVKDLDKLLETYEKAWKFLLNVNRIEINKVKSEKIPTRRSANLYIDRSATIAVSLDGGREQIPRKNSFEDLYEISDAGSDRVSINNTHNFQRDLFSENETERYSHAIWWKKVPLTL